MRFIAAALVISGLSVAAGHSYFRGQRWPSTSSSRSSDWRSDKCGDVLVLHKGTSDDIEDCADELKEDLERKFWVRVEVDAEGTLKSRSSSIDVDDYVIRPIELKKRTLRYDDCDDVFWDAYWELCEELRSRCRREASCGSSSSTTRRSTKSSRDRRWFTWWSDWSRSDDSSSSDDESSESTRKSTKTSSSEEEDEVDDENVEEGEVEEEEQEEEEEEQEQEEQEESESSTKGTKKSKASSGDGLDEEGEGGEST